MTGDEDHAVAHQFASQRHRLIGVAEVVADDQLDALPEDPALALRSATAISAARSNCSPPQD